MIDGLEAITFDFGNTLVPFPANSMATVVRRTAEWTREATGCRVEEFITVWGQERLRQFAEDVPEGRDGKAMPHAVDVRIQGVGQAHSTDEAG